MIDHDRKTDCCFVCASPGECSHREPDLRDYRTRAAAMRRDRYLKETERLGEADAQQTAYGRRCEAARAAEVVQPRKPPAMAPARSNRRESVTWEDAWRKRG